MKELVGLRVQVVKDPYNLPYLSKRKRYTDFSLGQFGTIIKNSGDKLGIQFDEEVFTGYNERLSSFDNGCHGYGKIHHCAYLPKDYINVIGIADSCDLSFYSNYKKIIVCDDVKRFYKEFENGKKETGYAMGGQLYQASTKDGRYKPEQVGYFFNSKAKTRVLIISTSDIMMDFNVVNLINDNKNVAYYFGSDSSFKGYMFRNVKICSSSWIFNELKDVQVFNNAPNITITIPRRNDIGDVYANNKEMVFVKGNVSIRDVRTIEETLTDGDEIIITNHHLDKLDKNIRLKADYKFLTSTCDTDCERYSKTTVSYIEYDNEFDARMYFGSGSYQGAIKKYVFKTEKEMKQHRIFVVLGNYMEFSNNFNSNNKIHIHGSQKFHERNDNIDYFINNGGDLIIPCNFFINGGIRFTNTKDIIYCAFIDGIFIFSEDENYVSREIYKHNKMKTPPLRNLSKHDMNIHTVKANGIDAYTELMKRVNNGFSVASEIIPIIPMSEPNIKIMFSDVVYDPINTDYENLIYTEYVEEL